MGCVVEERARNSPGPSDVALCIYAIIRAVYQGLALVAAVAGQNAHIDLVEEVVGEGVQPRREHRGRHDEGNDKDAEDVVTWKHHQLRGGIL